MQVEIITLPKQKTWGIIPHPKKPGHMHSGYVGGWNGDWSLVHEVGTPEKHMMLTKNVIITGDFKIDGMSRGRSAANFHGHFRGHEKVEYEFGMQGMLHLVELIQSDKFAIVDGYISGRWTFGKQGQSIFLQPYVGA